VKIPLSAEVIFFCHRCLRGVAFFSVFISIVCLKERGDKGIAHFGMEGQEGGGISLPLLLNDFYCLYGEIIVVAVLGTLCHDDELVTSRVQYV
jgi:hypothetical protein